jgi:hypothetical protein
MLNRFRFNEIDRTNGSGGGQGGDEMTNDEVPNDERMTKIERRNTGP